MNRLSRVSGMLCALALVVAGIGCMNHKAVSEGGDKTLYERLGGGPAVTAVVSDFVDRAAGDPKVNFTRAGHPNHWDPTPANVAKLKAHLVEFVAGATGGPKEYKGADMVSVHTGMQITNEEFDALAGDLKASLDKFNVPAKEQNDLLTIVGSTRESIVGK